MPTPVTIDTAAVIEAVKDTFETMAFMEVTPMDEENRLEMEEPLWATIEIMEPVQGRFTLVIPNALAEEITETLFISDTESPIAENLALDTLAELVNTIAGRLMSDQVNLEHTLSIGLPEYGRGLPETQKGLVIYLNIEEIHPITVVAEGNAFQDQAID